MYFPPPFITLYVYFVYKNYIDLSEVGAWGNSLQTRKEHNTHTHTHTHTHTVRPWDPLSSLKPLPLLIKVLKQEGLVVYQVL